MECLRLRFVLCTLLVVSACGDDQSTTPLDLGIDVETDAGNDSGVDSGVDVGSDYDLGSPFPWQDAELAVSADPNRIDVFGETTIRCEVSANGRPAPDRSRVLFEVTNGSGWLEGEDISFLERAVEDGVAEVIFLGDRSGVATVRASVERPDGTFVRESVAITVTGDRVDPLLTLVADLDEGVFGAGSRRLQLTATLTGEDGGPVEDVAIDFSGNEGAFSTGPDDAFELFDDISVESDELGVAVAFWDAEDFIGTAELEASVESDELEVAPATIVIQVVEAGSVELISFEPSELGLAGSGYNEQAEVGFQVRGSDGSPVGAGVATTLVAQSRIGVSVEVDETVTDELGQVWTTVRSAELPGPFEIVAKVSLGRAEVAGTSGRRWVVSGVAAGRFSSVECTPNNIGGLVGSDTPAAAADCTVSLRDRRNLAAPIPQTVYLVTEVGEAPESGLTDGNGEFHFAWTIDDWPADVIPMADRRGDERSFAGDDAVANVRDRAARVMFWTDGEEFFDDENGSGLREGGEPFWDEGEPFLDIDDSGFRDVDEHTVDSPWGHVSGDDGHEESNGRWDADTLVWGSTVVVLSGDPSFDSTPDGSDTDTYSYWSDAGLELSLEEGTSLGDGRRVFLELVLADWAGAPPNATATVDFEIADCDGALVVEPPSHVEVGDIIGFQLVAIESLLDVVGWSRRHGVTGFEPGARVDVEVFNPPDGATGECTLRASVEYSSCAACDDLNVVVAELGITAE